MTPRTTRSTLFPYTTLFRSRTHERLFAPDRRGRLAGFRRARQLSGALRAMAARGRRWEGIGRDCLRAQQSRGERSEEHTSELQSLAYLVCRLLLEKKNMGQVAVLVIVLVVVLVLVVVVLVAVGHLLLHPVEGARNGLLPELLLSVDLDRTSTRLNS